MRLLGEHLDEVRVGRAGNNGSVLGNDSGFLTRDVGERWTCKFGVIEPDVRNDCDRGIDNICCIPSTQQPHLNHHDVHCDISKPTERSSSDRLKETRTHPGDCLQLSDGCDLFGKFLIRNRLTIALNPFVNALEMRTGVRTYRQTRCHQQARNHLDG